MGKKRGNLRGALAAHAQRRDQRAKNEAAQEAQKRKLESMKPSGSGARPLPPPSMLREYTGEPAAKRRRHDTETGADGEDGDGGVAGTGAEVEQGAGTKAARLRRGRKAFMPFAKDDSILLVGEGNFSFTLSLLLPPHSLPPTQILATAYDTEQECYKKYPDAEAIVGQIRALATQAGGRADEVVVFGVDAGNLGASKAVVGPKKGTGEARRFSKIWFGFPHVGAGHKDETRNILANQLLLLRFFVSAAPLLSSGPLPAWAASSLTGKKQQRGGGSDDDDEGDEESVAESDDDDDAGLPRPSAPTMITPKRAGSVLITLRNSSPYTQWDVPTLAKRTQAMLPIIQRSAPSLPRGQRAPSAAELARAFPDPKKSYAVWRSAVFEPGAFPGYSHRRTVGFVEGLSTEANEDLLRAGTGGTGDCRTWEVGLVAPSS